jgi:hypothetical protein
MSFVFLFIFFLLNPACKKQGIKNHQCLHIYTHCWFHCRDITRLYSCLCRQYTRRHDDEAELETRSNVLIEASLLEPTGG